MELNLPKYVSDSLITIENAGFEAFCVGGAVRDLIMGLIPSDYDIATNAEPEIIMSIFPKTVPTGIRHGTVTVVTPHGNIEVTTYRTEGGYSNHRAPDNVHFVKSINDDLKRRDFTVNAICFNLKSGIFDPENGHDDIKSNTLRCIGNPDERFFEDALRIMRLFRFSAQLGFNIENESLKSAIRLSYLLESISVERIFVELKKAITSKKPDALSPLLFSGALEFLGLNATKIPNVINQLISDFSLRFSVLCHLFKTEAVSVLKNLKADNQTIDSVKIYTKLLNLPIITTKSELKRTLKFCSVEHIKGLFNYYNVLGTDISFLTKTLTEIIENKEPYLINHLAITGNDLIKSGFSGPEIGETLNRLLEIVIENPEQNHKENLLKLI